MDRYGIIYIIRNKINNKIYVGQTTQTFKRRYRAKGKGIEKVYNYHNENKNRECYYNNYLLSSIEKYGFDAFEVIEEFDVAYSKEELDKLEDMYIKVYDCIAPNGYNYKGGGANGKYSEISKTKLSESLSGENSPWLGRKHTKEWRENMSEYTKNRWKDEEYSYYMRERVKGEKNPMYGKKHTKEAKQKISRNSTKKRPVYCYEKDEIRLAMKEWAEELNLNPAFIGRVCRGERKSTGGYHFRYATEEEIKEYKLKNNIDK